MKILRYIVLFIHIIIATNVSAQNEVLCDSLLQEGIKASENKNYIQALELLNEAQEIATQDNTHILLFWIYSNIGICYAELLDYNTAIDNLSQAFDIASTHLDERYKFSVYNNIAGLYMIDKQYDKVLEQCMPAYNAAVARGDSLFMGGCATNIANASINLGMMEQTAQYLDIAEDMLVNYPAELPWLYILQADYYRTIGDYQEAYNRGLKAINAAVKYDKTAMIPMAKITLARIMYDIKDYNSAIRHAKEGLQQTTNIEEQRKLYEIISQCYYDLSYYKQACIYKDSVAFITDSIKEIHKELQFSNANIKIELLKKRNELEQYRLRTRTSYIVLGLGILASFILVWALINQIIKNRQEKEISQLNIEREKQQHQLLEKQLEEQRTQALLEEERYKHEIELRDKELMSKAMIVANRNDIVTNIVEELSKSQYFKETNNTVLKQTVSQLQRAIDNNEAWQDFSTYFEQRNDAFIAALREKHPELKANDIRFLSLIYINLSTKEIATLLNITPEYCKKKRQQLAKKMGFENTKALFTYLSTLA